MQGHCPSRSSVEIERDMLQRIAAGELHPWYGPCDGMGTNGECSECEREPEYRDALTRLKQRLGSGAARRPETLDLEPLKAAFGGVDYVFGATNFSAMVRALIAEVEHLRSELQRLQSVTPGPETEWQPIETMPRSGFFLQVWDNGKSSVIRWSYMWDCWHNIESYINLPNRVAGWWLSTDVLPVPPPIAVGPETEQE